MVKSYHLMYLSSLSILHKLTSPDMLYQDLPQVPLLWAPEVGLLQVHQKHRALLCER